MNQTSESNSQSGHQPGQDAVRGECEQTTPCTRWPWRAQLFLALILIIAVLVLLVGLPTASMLVAEKMSSGSDLSGTVSFWGALFAAFISLSVVIISGVFIITAFKVESIAKFEAHNAAIEGVREAKERVNEELRNAKKKLEDAKEELEEKLGKLVETEVSRTIANKAGDYIEKKGRQIITEVAETYIDKNGADIMGDTAKRSADTYIESNGANIVREGVHSYISEAVEDDGTIRIEKITRETVESISAEDIARRVDERLISLGFFEKARFLLASRGQGSGGQASGKGGR